MPIYQGHFYCYECNPNYFIVTENTDIPICEICNKVMSGGFRDE